MLNDSLLADDNKEHYFALAFDRLEQKVLEQNAIIMELKTWLQKLIDNNQGDVIESGGIKNVNINYYDTKNRSTAMLHDPDPILIPPRLQSPQAQDMHKNLIQTGLVDDLWQPLCMSGAERSLLAKAVCDRLDINDVWQVFGRLWSENPITLRSYYNKAMNQKKTYLFLEKLKNILN